MRALGSYNFILKRDSSESLETIKTVKNKKEVLIMRTYFEAKDFMNLKNVISTISAKDAIVSFTFGVKAVEDRIANICKVLAGTEQLHIQFTSLKPEDFTAPVAVHFKAKELLSVMGSLAAFNDRVYFEPVSGGCDIGIDDSANIKVPTLGTENIPQEIVPDKTKVCLQFTASANQFSEALTAGMGFTGDMNGLENVALFFANVLAEEEKVPATVKVCSTDGYRIGRGQSPIVIVNKEQVLNNRKETCKDGVMVVPMPKNNLSNLCKLLSMCKDCMVAVSDKHVSVGIGRTILYTFVRAPKVTSIFKHLETWIASPKAIQLVFDSEMLKQKVDLLNTAIKLYEEKKPVRFFIQKDKVRIGLDASNAAMVDITPVASEISQELEVNFNGEYLSSVITALKKGNLRISFIQDENIRKTPVEFSNGDLEKMAENSSVIYMTPVKDYEAPAPKEAESETETDGVSEE